MKLWLLPLFRQTSLQGLFKWLCHHATYLGTLGKCSVTLTPTVVGQVLRGIVTMALLLRNMHTADGVAAAAQRKQQTQMCVVAIHTS